MPCQIWIQNILSWWMKEKRLDSENLFSGIYLKTALTLKSIKGWFSSGCFQEAISKNFKGYAQDAGINGFHLHRIRHTYARIVAEESGSLIATQDALGHKNLATTRVYVQRIGVRKDRFSSKIEERLLWIWKLPDINKHRTGFWLSRAIPQRPFICRDKPSHCLWL